MFCIKLTLRKGKTTSTAGVFCEVKYCIFRLCSVVEFAMSVILHLQFFNAQLTAAVLEY